MITGLVLMVVAIIVVGVAGAMSWYVITVTFGGEGASIEFFLTRVCAEGTGVAPMCESYGTIGQTGVFEDRALAGIFGLTNTLMNIGLLLAVLALILLAVSAFFPRVGAGVLPAGLIGSLLVLGAPIYLFFALPTLFNVPGSPRINFFDSIGFLGSGLTVGGGLGWFAAFVAFLVLLVATSVAVGAVKTVAPLGNIRLGAPTYAPAYAPPRPPAGAPPTQQPYPPPTQQPYPPPTPPPSPPPAPPPTQQPLEPPEKVTPEETQVCPECGTPAPAGQAFCKNCGTKLTQD